MTRRRRNRNGERDDMTEQTARNIMDGLPPAPLPEELVEVLASSGGTRIERIVSTGQASPEGFWYDQDLHEWVMIVAGQARIEYDDGRSPAVLAAGDHLLIPAHRRHRVAWTDPDTPTVWLAVFFGNG